MIILAYAGEVDESLARIMLALSSCGFNTTIYLGKKKPSPREVLITKGETDEGLLVKGKTIFCPDNLQDPQELHEALQEVLNKFPEKDRDEAAHPMEKLLKY